MVLSKDALSFANTSYMLEAIQQKYLKEAQANTAEDAEEFVAEPARVDRDDISSWRRERMAAIKKMKAKSREYLDRGHGTVETVTEEKEVINICNTHQRVICHFYQDEFSRCKILDRLLSDLSAKHLEVKFIRMLASNSPFFTKKLGMQVLPTMLCSVDGAVIHVFTGFEEFRGDNITERILQSVLLKRGAITTECCDAIQEDSHSDDSE
ncbi:thioredoxin domain-containing protein 9 [Babesia gibsoni]|uniref:Thioredoxin domain-containing protein 9 n=1 Tax=Babesia gibsoni TaxID=33632 RepID=A0AAD8UUL5_BABGI|nr:thioredoxin domain-containing protein 9 [Babesia gibsoni]